MVYDSPKQIALYLAQRGLSLKKRFGQNFLVSPGARRKIIELLGAGAEHSVWEIGAGIGAMTHLLVDEVAKVVAFEIDHGLVRVLRESLGDRTNLHIVAGDYLKTWQDTSSVHGFPDRVVGNLPYRAAAPIIASIVEWKATVERAVFTVQREVAQRMAAAPGTKDYSGFSMVCQSVFSVRRAGDLAPASFYPVPEVTSTIVTLTPNHRPTTYDRNLFTETVRDLFAARRKTVKNNLLSGNLGAKFGIEGIETALRAAGIDAGARGEELAVGQVVGFVEELSRRESERRSRQEELK